MAARDAVVLAAKACADDPGTGELRYDLLLTLYNAVRGLRALESGASREVKS